jgi:hypothetical protein
MNSMLDREMPVTKKDNQKFILFFLFASFFFLGGLFTQKYVFEDSGKSLNNENNTAAYISKDLVLNENNAEIKESIVELNSEEKKGQSFNKANTKITVDNFKSNNNQSTFQSDSFTDFEVQTKKELKKENPFLLTKNEETPLVLPSKEVQYLALNPISILSPNELSFASSKLTLDIKPLTLNHKRLIDRFILEFGPELVGTSNMDFIGYGGMINMGFNVTDKISFNIGANLNRFDRVDKIVTYDAVTFVAPVSPEYQDLNDNLTSHYDNLNRFVDISIPVGIEYFAHDKISFNGGMVFRSSVYKEIQGYPLHIQNSNNSIENNYESSFLNPYVGVGFNMNQYFSLNLNYEHGTKSIINTTLYPSQQNKLSILKLSMSFKLL